jgi:ectoine hydroxylase-related dioxygenase (phytanoyl-CoA dioxygenase family)
MSVAESTRTTSSSDWVMDLRTRGYTVIRDLIPVAEVEALRELVETRRAAHGARTDVATEKSPLLTQLLFASNRAARLVRDLYWDERVQWILGSFHAQPVIEHTKVLIKAAGAPETPWHQDHAFFHDFDPTGTMITLWSPFHAVHPGNGALRVAKEPVHALLPHDRVNEDGELAIQPAALGPALAGGVDVFEVGPGDAVFFTSRVVHGTYPNPTDADRLAFKLVFQDLEKRAAAHPLRERAVRFDGARGIVNRVVPCGITRLRLQPKQWKTRLKSRFASP